jgi:hypothetical protein
VPPYARIPPPPPPRSPLAKDRVLHSRSYGSSPRSRLCVIWTSQGSLNSTRMVVLPAHLSDSSSTCCLQGGKTTG